MTLYVSIAKNIDGRCFCPRISPPIRMWLKFIIRDAFTVAVGLSSVMSKEGPSSFLYLLANVL